MNIFWNTTRVIDAYGGFIIALGTTAYGIWWAETNPGLSLIIGTVMGAAFHRINRVNRI